MLTPFARVSCQFMKTKGHKASLPFNPNKLKIILMGFHCTEINNCEKSEIKPYICPNIFLKGCLALSNQTERQAEIKPVVVGQPV